MLRLKLLAGLVLRKDMPIEDSVVLIRGNDILIGPEKNPIRSRNPENGRGSTPIDRPDRTDIERNPGKGV